MKNLRLGKTLRQLLCASCVVYVLGFPATTIADTVTFDFSPVGNSFLAFLPPDSPLIGREVISARIYLNVESFASSDAANFFTDISFPIDPSPGHENALAIFGGDLGWSGSGVFHFFEETTLFNGIFVSTRYGGETPGENLDGKLLEGSRIEFQIVPESGGVFLLAIGGVAAIGLRGWFRGDERGHFKS